MKQTRKLLAMLLCIAMVLGMATTVFAAETTTPAKYTITINNKTDGHTYEAYQIFTGVISDAADSDAAPGTSAILSDVAWGASVTNAAALNEAGNTAPVVAKKLANNEMTVDQLLALVDLSETAHKSSTDKGDFYLIEDLVAGYYLIKDKDNSLPSTEHDAYTDFIMEVVENSVVSPKSSTPTVDKVILDNVDDDVEIEEVRVNEAAIGETVDYKITGTLPTNLADYKEYYYKFTDTLSKGLTYNDNLTVSVVNGTVSTDVTDYFHVNASEYNEETGTTITVTIGDILALNNIDITVNKDTQIVLEYSAVVNENAIINGANPNKVDLTYSNDPNHSGDGTPGNPPEYPPENPGDEPGTDNPIGKTPESEVETYVTEVHIEKVDGALKALEGASFEITGTALKTVIVTSETFTKDENGTYWKLTDGTFTTDDPNAENMDQTKYESTTVKYSVSVKEVVVETEEEVKASGAVGTDGKLTFTGLPAGTYTVKEIVTPAGYNTIGEIYLEVTFDADEKTFSYNWTGAFEGTGDTAQVINQAGSTLPETGGIGTTLFYVFGGIMVLGAAVLLVTKKRMTA